MNVKPSFKITSSISSLDLKALDLPAPWYRLRGRNLIWNDWNNCAWQM